PDSCLNEYLWPRLHDRAWHGHYRGLYYDDSVLHSSSSTSVQVIVRPWALVPNSSISRNEPRESKSHEVGQTPAHAGSVRGRGATQSHATAVEVHAALPMGVIVLEVDGTIAAVNLSAMAMLGAQPESLCGQPALGLLAALRECAGEDAPTRAQL